MLLGDVSQAALEGVSLRAYMDHRLQEAARAKRATAEEAAVSHRNMLVL